MSEQLPLTSGVTEKTPGNLMLGAGTIHKGLAYSSETGWNFKESVIGATNGGTKLTITPEIMQAELDDVMVAVEGLDAKVGETAVLETNFSEITPEIMTMAIIGQSGDAATETGYTEVKSKARIEKGDYIENLAFVGKTLEGKPIIIIFKKALCTSGLELEGKSKEYAVMKATFECRAELSGDLQTLPYRILYPKPAGVLKAASAKAEPAKAEK